MKQLLAFVLLTVVCLIGSCQAADNVGSAKMTVTVTNPLMIQRQSETICIEGYADKFVFDVQTEKLVRTQSYDGKLLFQTDLGPGETKKFRLTDESDGLEVPTSEVRTHCRFIPERKDDFGWESDKAAYRMYGPALEYETITCGIDAWGKSVPEPIIDRYIKEYVEKHIPYHNGHDDGGDFYKVGNTLGCGAMAPFIDGKIRLPRNFVTSKVITNGPIRSEFELTYNQWKAGGFTVSEVKRISIDLGSNLSRIECKYSCQGGDKIPVAAGIILRNVSRNIWAQDGTIAYWIPADYKEKGNLGCGVVFAAEYDTKINQADDHLLLTLEAENDKPVVYYSGSCWDKNTQFDSFDKWQTYLKNFKKQIDNPVTVSIEK